MVNYNMHVRVVHICVTEKISVDWNAYNSFLCSFSMLNTHNSKSNLHW